MLSSKRNTTLAASLVFAVALWGGNNAGTKWLVTFWPPIFTGGTRFLAAGLLLMGILRWTTWFGTTHEPSSELKRKLWLRGGLTLAAYIVAFNGALRFISASNVALFLGASPVWALLWEGLPDRSWRTAQRYGAALLALAGVGVLVWPALHGGDDQLYGDLLAFASSLLWTAYGRQCRSLGSTLTGVEITAHTMWRAGIWLVPLASLEVAHYGLTCNTKLLLVLLYCVVAGGVISFAIWSTALRYWPTSRVLLFNNLIPLSTMTWAYFCLGEPVTSTFWIAMFLIGTGVILGQTNLQRPAVTQPEL